MGLDIKPSPPKCPKCNSYHPVMLPSHSTEQDETVYTRNKLAMQQIKHSDQESKTAQFLLKEALILCHTWIEKHFPVVREILSEFPLLKCNSNVRGS